MRPLTLLIAAFFAAPLWVWAGAEPKPGIFFSSTRRHTRYWRDWSSDVCSSDLTAEIRVRLVVLLLVAFVALAERLGLETILGAFLAGALVGLVDRDSATHPRFRAKLDAIGYGFLIPVFFVSSGVRLDLRGLLEEPTALLQVPVFLVALLVVRGLPAVLYRNALGRTGSLAAGLLQATSL